MNSLYQTVYRPHKLNAVITGLLYIAAAAASISALRLYGPILFNTSYLTDEVVKYKSVIAGGFCELLAAGTVAGTAIMLYPYLRRYNERLGLTYLCFRWFEAVLILMGTVGVLTMFSLSQLYKTTLHPADLSFHVTASMLKALYCWTLILGPNFMLGINTFIYSVVFFKTQLIPRMISTLGIIASIFIFVASLLEMFGIIQQLSISGALLAFPIFIYEMTLAFWLLFKGFNSKNPILKED